MGPLPGASGAAAASKSSNNGLVPILVNNVAARNATALGPAGGSVGGSPAPSPGPKAPATAVSTTASTPSSSSKPGGAQSDDEPPAAGGAAAAEAAEARKAVNITEAAARFVANMANATHKATGGSKPVIAEADDDPPVNITEAAARFVANVANVTRNWALGMAVSKGGPSGAAAPAAGACEGKGPSSGHQARGGRRRWRAAAAAAAAALRAAPGWSRKLRCSRLPPRVRPPT